MENPVENHQVWRHGIRRLAPARKVSRNTSRVSFIAEDPEADLQRHLQSHAGVAFNLKVFIARNGRMIKISSRSSPVQHSRTSFASDTVKVAGRRCVRRRSGFDLIC
jgi:hypothetical protein